MIEAIENLVTWIATQFRIDSVVVATIVAAVSLLTIVAAVGAFLWRLFMAYKRWKIETASIKNLHPNYGAKDVLAASKYFVQTKFQNVSPSEDEEPNRLYASAAKQLLTPFFVNEVFSCKQSSGQLFMILAESGMGKSTFLVNLYLTFARKKRFNPLYHSPYSIVLTPFTAPSLEQRLAEVPDKPNTILLLDALDEDALAQKDYKTRLDGLYALCREFKFILITCRTQFFPSESEEPHRAGYLYGGNDPELKFQKLYLAPFSDKDIRTFLRKRYPLINPLSWSRYRRAKRMILNIPKLSMRPLALTFVDALSESRAELRRGKDLYEAFIQYWCKREALKPSVREKYGNERSYEVLLYAFSMKLANYLFRNRQMNPRLAFVPGEKKFEDSADMLESLGGESGPMSAHEKRSQSLLNRDAGGNYKFAHKSILEYFVAKEMMTNVDYFLEQNLQGYDQVLGFLHDRANEQFPEIPNRMEGISSMRVWILGNESTTVYCEVLYDNGSKKGGVHIKGANWDTDLVGALIPLFARCNTLHIHVGVGALAIVAVAGQVSDQGASSASATMISRRLMDLRPLLSGLNPHIMTDVTEGWIVFIERMREAGVAYHGPKIKITPVGDGVYALLDVHIDHEPLLRYRLDDIGFRQGVLLSSHMAVVGRLGDILVSAQRLHAKRGRQITVRVVPQELH